MDTILLCVMGAVAVWYLASRARAAYRRMSAPASGGCGGSCGCVKSARPVCSTEETPPSI